MDDLSEFAEFAEFVFASESLEEATQTPCNVCGQFLVYFEDTERYHCKNCDMEFVESD